MDEEGRSGQPSDEEIARDAGALGRSSISQHTGTGGPSASSGDTRTTRGRRSAVSTAGTTDNADDLLDAAGPSGTDLGGTGSGDSAPVSPQRGDSAGEGGD